MRYEFNLRKLHVWRDMLTNRHYFWAMWGIRQTLGFIVKDTLGANL